MTSIIACTLHPPFFRAPSNRLRPGADGYYEFEINSFGTIYEVLFFWLDAYEKKGYNSLQELDPSATYFEYKLYLTIADGEIKYELNSVKAFYYQLLGSNRTINDGHDIVEDAMTPTSAFGPGRYDPLPVSNYLDHGYATLMGRDAMVKFYTEIDQNIQVVLASLRKSVTETGSSNK